MNKLELRLEIAVARRIAAGQTAPETIEAADLIIIEAGGSLDDDAPEIRDEVAAIAWHLDPRPDEVAAILETHLSEPGPELDSAPAARPLGPPLNEKALRKPGWQEGVWVRLRDGQRWCIPPIVVQWGARTLADGTIETTFPHGVPTPVISGAILFHCSMRRPLNAFLGHLALFRIAAALLAENYEVDEETAHNLMPYTVFAPAWAAEVQAYGGTAEINATVSILAYHAAPFLTEYRTQVGLPTPA